MAQAKGCQQVLWLHDTQRYITEVGTMNVFMCLKDKKGKTEIVTPPLNGLILPGVTRQSILDLGRTWVSHHCGLIRFFGRTGLFLERIHRLGTRDNDG